MQTNPRARLVAACIGVVLGPAMCAAQTPHPPRAMEDYRKAVVDLRKNDLPSAIVHLKAVLAAAPSHPGVMAALAQTCLASGQPQAALGWLVRATALEGGLEALDDEKVVRFLETAEARAVAARIAALRAPSGASEVAFRVRERDLIPEGIAYDPATRSFFLSSIYKRKIVRVDSAGRATDFVASKQDGLLSTLGMKVDSRRRALWVATEAGESMIDSAPSDKGRSAIFKYDLRSGKLVKAYWLPPGPTRHLCNDLVLDSGGDVFITDSEEGSLYTIPSRTDRLERLLGPATWDDPNGIALSADERTLYVAHAWGITLVERASEQMRELEAPAGITTVGMDGLYRNGRSLLGVQNGIVPMRIVEFALNEVGDRVVSARTLARNHPSFDIPTTGVIVGRGFYYIANSQLNAFLPDNGILPPERLQDVVVLRSPLE